MIEIVQVEGAAITFGFGVIAVFVGVWAIRGLLLLVDFTQTRMDGDESPPVNTVRGGARRLGGGAWIGMMERLAIFACLMSGFPEGIAIVLGIKGLARYPELRSPDAATAQAFIIGTFASVMFAAACAGAATGLLGLL